MTTEILPRLGPGGTDNNELCHAAIDDYDAQVAYFQGTKTKARCGEMFHPKPIEECGSHCEVCKVCEDLVPHPHPGK